MIQEVYVTISVNKKDLDAARSFFIRTTSTLQTQLQKMGSACRKLSGIERLNLLHDIYRGDKTEELTFNLEQALRQGSSAKNYIAPESMEIEVDYFKLGGIYGRALVLHGYPTYLKDSVVSDLCELNRRMIFSMDIIPVPTDEAVQEAERRATGVESTISKWYQKQYNNKNYAPELTYDLKQQREQAQEYLTDLLDISENQQEYITNAKPGSGLIKVSGTLIPFENDIPQDTEIYKLLTTKPDEAIYDIGM